MCEIDIWCINGNLYLGHDQPTYPIKPKWISDRKDVLLCHAKNIEALHRMEQVDGNLHYFWHDSDDYTLTSYGVVVCYPGKSASPGSILMKAEHWSLQDPVHYENYSLCSDYILNWKKDESSKL